MLNVEATVRSRIVLPPTLVAVAFDAVAARSGSVEIDSYLPVAPDAYPAVLDSGVCQGSNGRVFPLLFHERIAQQKVPHAWQAVHLENEFVRIMILPELGGRSRVACDKVAKYDMFYRNNVIKPALVGLASPWLSGGVEFNWPQLHRPATLLPTDVVRTACLIIALLRLGKDTRANELFDELAEVRFFATILRTKLLFIDDPQRYRDR